MPRDAASDRRARLAQALRENLKRRKAQGRGRAAAAASARGGGKDDTAGVAAPATTGKTRED
jgi:hypothetical protein